MTLLFTVDKVMELLKLPSELIFNIITFLSGRDVQELSLVNHELNELCDCHRIWYNIIEKYTFLKSSFCDIPLESLKSVSRVSLKSLYINVLSKWDWLLGFWKRNTAAFGGLLFVKLEMTPCRIMGYDVQSKELKKNLVPMFAINIVEKQCHRCKNIHYSNGNNIKCILYSKTDHNLTFIDSDNENGDEFKICCLQGGSDEDHNREEMISDFLDTVGINHVDIPNAIFRGFINGGISFRKINIPHVSCDLKLVEPGFFAGDFSAHGTEIVLLKYYSNRILLEKVLGDKNVRCGAVSIDIDMSCPVDYSKVLRFIAEQPDEFNVKNTIQRFQIKEGHSQWLAHQNKYNVRSYVDKDVIKSLRFTHPDRTFGIDESDNSFIAAFKGKITLGRMPDAVIPNYFYYEVLAVVTNEDSLCVYRPYEESYFGIFLTAEKLFKRLCF